MEFQAGKIDGAICKPLQLYNDDRGWLCELYRLDDVPDEFHPVMAYASITKPGVCRGPHEHADQADYFCFFGPSQFKLRMWDNRPASPTFKNVQTDVVGVDNPMMVIIPPGVVHGYKNTGQEPGLVLNCPNRLYRGLNRSQPVDEIRHEADANSPFLMDG